MCEWKSAVMLFLLQINMTFEFLKTIRFFILSKIQTGTWSFVSQSGPSEAWGRGWVRYRPRFFDQIGHQTTCAFMRNKHFSNKLCHHQTYENYEQSWQKLDTFLVKKLLYKSKFSKIFINLNFFGKIRPILDNKKFEIFDKVVHNFGKSNRGH